MSDARKVVVEYVVDQVTDHPSTVLVEVEADPDAGVVPISNGVLSDAPNTFQEALERVKPALQAVADALRDVNHPDTIALEFGLKLTAATGVVIASAATEVTFKVTLSWKKASGQAP